MIEGKELTATTFASCDSLGRLLMWRFEDGWWTREWAQLNADQDASGGPRCIQKIEHRANYPLCLSLAHLPGSKSRVLLTGNTDKKIHFWVEKGEEARLATTASHYSCLMHHICSLHTSWHFRGMRIGCDPLTR